MFAQTSALLFFIAEELAYRKPFQRFFELSFVRGDDARQGGRQFGSHRHFAFPFINEIEKLIDNFCSALLAIEISRFEQRCIPLDKTITLRGLAPFLENVISSGTISRQK